MAQNSLNLQLSPSLAKLLDGTIYDLSMDLATIEDLSELAIEHYLEYHAFAFLYEEIARNPVAYVEILLASSQEDFCTPSPYESIHALSHLSSPVLMELTKCDLRRRIIGNFFKRFLALIKQRILGR
jgi:hypothetical protein